NSSIPASIPRQMVHFSFHAAFHMALALRVPTMSSTGMLSWNRRSMRIRAETSTQRISSMLTSTYMPTFGDVNLRSRISYVTVGQVRNTRSSSPRSPRRGARGQCLPRRSGYGSRAEAQEALDDLKHPAPAAPAPVASITLGEAFERYFQAKARKRSLAEDQKIAKHFKAEFGEKTPLADITASRISQYKTKRLAVKRGELTLSAAAINRPLALLRHLLRLACEEWEVLSSVPKIRLEKEGQGRLRWLTPEEATNLLTKCRKQKNAALVDLVEFALYTGLRQG